MKESWRLIFGAFAFICWPELLNIKAEIDPGTETGAYGALYGPLHDTSPLIAQLRNTAVHFGLDNYFTNDKQLSRYIESANYNVGRAAGMLTRTANWRKAYGVDHILDWIPPSILFESFPYYVTGFTHEGNPVIYLPTNKWNVRAVRKAGLGPEVSKYVIRMLEDIRTCLEGLVNPRTGEPVDQVVILENADGLVPHPSNYLTVHNNIVPILHLLFTSLDRHYPFLAKRLIALHTPLILQAAWTAVGKHKPRLGSVAKFYNRFSIRSLHDLAHSVPKHALPVELGGTFVMPSHEEAVHW